jgi:hypothetical protein
MIRCGQVRAHILPVQRSGILPWVIASRVKQGNKD